MDRFPCPGCAASGHARWFVDRVVVFWSRGAIFWRDEAHQAGDSCGHCGVPDATLLWNGWAERKAKQGRAGRPSRIPGGRTGADEGSQGGSDG